MKKLMTMLAAVATAFGLYAADEGFISGAGFDTSDTANPTKGVYTWLYDTGSSAGTFASMYWANTTGLTVVGGKSIADDDNNRPLQFIDKDRVYSGYLNVETKLGNPVGQYVKEGGDVQGIGDGLYFDALVKPTVFDADGEPTATIEDDENAKIGIYAQMNEAENETNLYVYAGSTPAPYKTTTKIDDSKWIRLTIKMIENINKDGVAARPGYVVFVNETAVECLQAKLDPANLKPEAQEWNKTGSLFEGLTDSTEVKEVLFDGKGSVDEIAFTTTAPKFAEDFKKYTITWDPAKVGTVTFDPAAQATNGTTVTFMAQSLPPSVTMTWTANAEYAAGEKILAPTAGGSYTLADGDYTKGVAKVDEVAYADLDDAIDAAVLAAKPVVLLDTITDAIEIEANVTLDLNGQNVTVEEGDVITVTKSATLTIVDDDNTSEISSGDGGYAIVSEEGVVIVGAGTYAGGVSLSDGCELNGGLFSTTDNDKDCLDDYAKDGFEFVDNEAGYFELKEVAKTGTVIFICDKLGAPVTNEQVVGTSVALPTPTDPTLIRTFEGWFEEEALLTPVTEPVTVVEGETKIYGKAEIVIVDNEIATALDLQKLQAAVAEGKTFAGETLTQTANITLTDWTGIGTVDEKAFSGVYNGNGQTLNISYAGKSNYGGFFNYLANGAVISNLTFEASLGTEPNDGEFGFAAVAGKAVASTIADITVNGTIGTAAKPLRHNAAGVVVRADGGTIIKDCVNNASVFGAYTKMGGFVAIVNGGGTVTFENCVNNGDITAKTIDNGKTAGADGLSGILGYTQSNAAIVLNNCENKGTLTGIEGSTIGTIVGKVQNGSVTATGCKAQADVASFGAIVTAGTPVTGLSFATVDAGVATFVADDALALDGEYKVMAANAAPVFEFKEAGTIAFNTNMFFVADFSGITAPDLDLTSAEKDGIVTFTAATPAPVDPIRPVDPQAGKDVVNAAIDAVDYADKAAIKAAIGGDATKYNAFADWAKTVDGGQAAVIASSYAAKSFQLAPFVDGNVLFTDEPTLTTTAIAADTETAGNWTFTVKLTNGAKGELVTLLEGIANCAKVSEDLATWGAATATATINKDGTATIKITPPTGDKAFMKVEVK